MTQIANVLVVATVFVGLDCYLHLTVREGEA